MEFLEKDLEQIIFETPNEYLQFAGLELFGKKKRQLRIGNYGIADIVAFRRFFNYYTDFLHITVCELKKDSINISTFLQAIRYVKGIDQYLKFRKFKHKVRFSIILCGKTINLNSDLIYLADLVDCSDNKLIDINFYTYDYKINGLKFEKHNNYKLIDEGFKS